MNRPLGEPTKSDRIISDVIARIRNGEWMTGTAIFSINEAVKTYGVARKTVVRAYEKLAEKGFIISQPKRGFFVINNQPCSKIKVLLILHSYEAHFEQLYHEFREQVNDCCDIDIYFHHYNPKILELILHQNLSEYDYFIISSFNHPRVPGILGSIPGGKILIVSRNDRVEKRYNCIVQDFYDGTYQSLLSARERIMRYHKIYLSFPNKSGHPESLKMGFLKFCHACFMSHEVVDSLDHQEIQKGTAFLIIDDSDLIRLLKVCKERGWKPGSDIGVISYNETPLKEVIRDGITVISCNFREMGREMAQFIKNRKNIQKCLPIRLVIRNSL